MPRHAPWACGRNNFNAWEGLAFSHRRVRDAKWSMKPVPESQQGIRSSPPHRATLPSLFRVFVTMLWVCSQASAQRPWQSPLDKTISDIGSKMRITGKLLPGDRKTLLQGVEAKAPTCVMAMLTLHLAVNQHLFPIQEFRKVVEHRARRAEPDLAWICSDVYAGTFNLHGKAVGPQPSIRKANANAKELSPTEMSFCESVLGNSSEGVQLRCGSLLASKQDLDPKSRAWIESKIDHQIHSPKSKSTTYWEFLKRLVAYRNPGNRIRS